MSWEDIQTDHLDVPALVFFRNSKGLSSEPQPQWFYFFTVATICIFRRNHVAKCIFGYFAEHVADGIFDHAGNPSPKPCLLLTLFFGISTCWSNLVDFGLNSV